jgi:hypothetical protein
LNRKTNKVTLCARSGGPIFYATKVGSQMFFSTVVEPSKINRQDSVELWSSSINEDSWKIIHEFKKDIGNKIIFQYGQIKFPNGIGDNKNLWFTPFATSYSHKVLKIRL